MPLFFLWFHKSQGGMSSNSSVITTHLPSLGTHPQKGSSSSGFMWKRNRSPVVSSATLRGMSRVPVLTAMSGQGEYIFSIPSFLQTAVLKAKRKQTHIVKSSEPVLVILHWKQTRSPWLRTGPKWWGPGDRKWVSTIFPMERIFQICCGSSASLACPVYYYVSSQLAFPNCLSFVWL